jgi:hypothetical protein
MQTLQLGSAQVLTFYDSGANGNLIDGSLAESLGLPVLDDTPATVTVVGGGSISTKYGTYGCILGPDASNQYHELELQGIESITKPYPPIDLSSLAVEASKFLPNQAWPSQIGGCDVQLLIGIKNTLLVPRVKFVMPNGLAIYESALTDVFGSRLCFGGPHALFTEVYRSRGGNYNSLEAILTETASTYRQSPWTFICKGEPSSKDGAMALALELQTPPPKQEIPASLDAPLVEAPSLEVMLTSVEHQENLILPTRESQLKSPDAPLVEAPSSEVMLTSAEHQEPKSGSPTADDQGNLDPPSCSHPHHQGLTKKHGGDNNRYQAARIYQAQCKKPEFVKEGVRKAHSDLVTKNLMRSTPTIKIKRHILIPKLGGRNRPLRARQKTGQVAHTAGDYADKHTHTVVFSALQGAHR